jgi:hypothetical protein
LKRIVTVTNVVHMLGYEIMDSSFCNQGLQCIFTCCFWQLTNLPQLQQIEHRLARMHARSIHSQACTHLAHTCITNLSFTSQTTHKQIKAAPQSIPSSLSEHIYEIVEKSSQKQFECSCNLTRVGCG